MKNENPLIHYPHNQFQPPNTYGEIENVIRCCGIEVSSRVGSAQEVIEMLAFCKIAKDQGIADKISSLFYSKWVCNIKVKDEDPLLVDRINKIGTSTLSQFEVDVEGTVYHGWWNTSFGMSDDWMPEEFKTQEFPNAKKPNKPVPPPLNDFELKIFHELLERLKWELERDPSDYERGEIPDPLNDEEMLMYQNYYHRWEVN